MSIKRELHRLIDDLSEDDARQALEDLRGSGPEAERAFPTADAGYGELTEEEGRALFDRAARTIVGISGEEFLCEWDEGTLDPDDPRVVDVAMLIPFARPA